MSTAIDRAVDVALGAVIRDPGEAYQEYENAPSIAVDIETSGLNPWRDKIAVIALAAPGRRPAVIHSRGLVPDPIAELLEDDDRLIIGHNTSTFDYLFLDQAGVDVFRAKAYDTLTAEGVVIKTDRKDVRRSLEKTAQRRLGARVKGKNDHKGWMNDSLTDEQVRYALGDVLFLHRLHDVQVKTAAEDSRSRALEFELSLIPLVVRMSLNGLPFDRREYADYSLELEGARDECLGRLVPLVGGINLRSFSQALRALQALGYERRSTAHDVLLEEWLALSKRGEEGELIDALGALIEYRGFDQPLKMYKPTWVDEHVIDGRVHAKFWSVGTDTGRFSSSGPNLQQVPKSARRVFRAQGGRVIVAVDYSALEVRVSAHYSKDEQFIGALDSEDIHRTIASMMYRIPVQEVTDLQRRLSKAMSFTALFGGSAHRTYEYARLNGSTATFDQVEGAFYAFLERFPGIQRMRAAARARTSGRAVAIRLPTGMIRVIAGPYCTPTRFLNTIVQGTAAVGMKRALLEAHRAGLMPYLGATVHDELVGDPPAGIAEEFTRELEGCMVRGMREVVPSVPIGTEAWIGPSWKKGD
jgi:DNA polymerase I